MDNCCEFCAFQSTVSKVEEHRSTCFVYSLSVKVELERAEHQKCQQLIHSLQQELESCSSLSSSSSSLPQPETNPEPKTAHDNLMFFKNETKAEPGELIETIHETWFGQHSLISHHHPLLLHWLFPSRRSPYHPLQEHEISAIKDDPVLLKRVRKSFELMLDSFGMQLDPVSFTISRAPH